MHLTEQIIHQTITVLITHERNGNDCNFPCEAKVDSSGLVGFTIYQIIKPIGFCISTDESLHLCKVIGLSTGTNRVDRSIMAQSEMHLRLFSSL